MFLDDCTNTRLQKNILIELIFLDKEKSIKTININLDYNDFLTELNLKKISKKNKLILNNQILNNYTYKKIQTTICENIYNNIYQNKKKNNIKILKLEIIPRLNGGFIMELFSAIISLLKMLAGIPNMFLYIIRFILWSIQFLVFLISMLFQVLDKDGIIGLFKYITGEIILAPFKFILLMIKRFANNFGNITISALSGADNVKGYDEDEPTEFHATTSSQEKCYRTSDGLIPFSVIIGTILCPPIGVFMEYGLFGWFNILICALLTLCFYFPGLIYALILLYC